MSQQIMRHARHKVTARRRRGIKHELSTGLATGQMANKCVYAFIFRKMPFLGG